MRRARASTNGSLEECVRGVLLRSRAFGPKVRRRQAGYFFSLMYFWRVRRVTPWSENEPSRAESRVNGPFFWSGLSWHLLPPLMPRSFQRRSRWRTFGSDERRTKRNRWHPRADGVGLATSTLSPRCASRRLRRQAPLTAWLSSRTLRSRAQPARSIRLCRSLTFLPGRRRCRTQ